MSQRELSRREFLESAGAAAALAMLGGGASLSLVSGAIAAPGKPIPPKSVMYYGNWQEYVEFWRKAALDLKRIGLTVILNPAASATVITKTKAHDYGDIAGIAWGAVPNRLDPSFHLTELLHSALSVRGSRNFGKYRSAKYDADASEPGNGHKQKAKTCLGGPGDCSSGLPYMVAVSSDSD